MAVSQTQHQPMAQINVRIDRAAKERGDDGLASTLGISPSSLIRRVWQVLSDTQGARELARVLNIDTFHSEPEEAKPSEIDATMQLVAAEDVQRRQATLNHMFCSFESFGQEHGLDISLLHDDTCDDVRAEVMQEKLSRWQGGDLA